MTPRRIAYILNIFPKLSETFIISELSELHERKMDLRIFALLPPRDSIQNTLVTRTGLDRLVSYDVSMFPEQIRQFAPDLIHAHFAKEATATALEIARTFQIPFTFTAHGYDIHRKPPPDFGQRAAAASAVITVSNANADYIEHAFQVPRPHIHVIPCGVDLGRFRPADPARNRENPPLVLCVARHVAVKNLGLLLEACALLRDSLTPFRCVIIGDGPLRAELEAKRAQLGLERQVEMPGAASQDEVAAWWQRAAVGVLTSLNEGMPVCLMEAAACGVPVVATRVGGIPELVQDGVTGLLCPSGDPAAICQALHRLLQDQQLRRNMGAAALQRARDRFSVARQVDSLLDLWSHIV